jgi:hypothetical protein
VPAEKPAAWTAHRAGTGKAPTTGKKGTVYERFRKSGGGSTSVELGGATTKWLKEQNPSALDSKVGLLFREKGWEIIWTPPYCPKFQMASSGPANCTSRAAARSPPRSTYGEAGTVVKARNCAIRGL